MHFMPILLSLPFALLNLNLKSSLQKLEEKLPEPLKNEMGTKTYCEYTACSENDVCELVIL